MSDTKGPTPTAETPLHVWVAIEKKRLQEFESFWIEGARGPDAEAFPMELPEGEWDEQYRCWAGG
jgi:hypothetical protein